MSSGIIQLGSTVGGGSGGGTGSVTGVASGAGLTGGPITTTGTLSVVADAGMPSQTGNTGKYLTSNGTVSSWGTLPASGTGTVTGVATGTGLTGGPIATTGTISVVADAGLPSQTGANTKVLTSNGTVSSWGGPPVTAWGTVAVSGSFTTSTTYAALIRTVGDSRDLKVRIAFSGAPNSTAAILNLPFTINTAKMLSVSTTSSILADVRLIDIGNNNYAGHVEYLTSTSLYIGYSTITGLDGLIQAVATQAAPFAFNNGDSIEITISGLPVD